MSPARRGTNPRGLKALQAGIALFGLCALSGCGNASSDQPGASGGGESNKGSVTLPLLVSSQKADDGMAAKIAGKVTLRGRLSRRREGSGCLARRLQVGCGHEDHVAAFRSERHGR